MILEAFPLPDGYIDRRAYSAKAHARSPKRPQGYPVYERPWNKTTGICLHQTACDMGERIERYDATGAHIVILRSGRWIQLHDLNLVVAAANGWNGQTVSIEVNGLFAGVVGGHVWNDPSTVVHEVAMHPTPIQLVRLQEIERWICGVVAKNGGEIKVIVAHRQSSPDRPDDPGEEVWKGGALPVMSELGLSDGGVGFALPGGRPIPEEWDPRCKGVRY